MATITTSLSNAEYRSVSAYSKSDLDLISKSPALIEWSRKAPRAENQTAEIGTATHAAILEPGVFASLYIREPNVDKRTKAGKEAAESFSALASEQGKTALSVNDYDMVLSMRDSVMAHPVARELLSRGVAESSIFFEVDGVKTKCRPDWICDAEHFGRHILVDVKTTDDIEKFAYSIRDYRYHVQDAFYSDGYEQLTGEKPAFVFVVVGKKRVFGAHQVRVFELDIESKDAGRKAYLADIARVQELNDFGLGLHFEQIKMAKIW